MPTYKLTYFDLKGRAAPSRMLFALAGVEYEDVRVPRDEWAKKKSDSKFGQLPMLEVDGEVICQSHAIERFLARTFGYYSNDAWECAKIDMLVDCVEDVGRALVVVRNETDDQKKAEKMKEFKEQKMPEYLTKFESFLISNNGGDGYFVGDRLTLADINFKSYTEFVEAFIGGPLDWSATFPKLGALRERVRAEPKIAEWIAKRPATDF